MRTSAPTVACIVAASLAVLWLACSCLASTDTKEGRRAEGEQLLASARDALLAAKGKLQRKPLSVSEAAPVANFAGEYFKVLDRVYEGQWPQQHEPPMLKEAPLAIVAAPVNPADGWCVMYIDWSRDRKWIEWYDAEPEFVVYAPADAGGASQ